MTMIIKFIMLARKFTAQITKSSHFGNIYKRTLFSSSETINNLLKESTNKFGDRSGALIDVSSTYFGKLEDLSEDALRHSVEKSVSMLEELDKEVHKNDYFRGDQITVGINLGPISISRTKIVE